MLINDPSAVLDDILEAIFDDDDLEAASEWMAALKAHLSEGGPNPDFSGRPGQWRCEKMMDCIDTLLRGGS